MATTSFQLFYNSLKSSKTKYEYSRLLEDFKVWKQYNSIDQLLVNPVKQDLIEYLMYLKDERHLSSSSRSKSLAAMRHFYEMNDVVFPWIQIAKFIGESEKEHVDRNYTNEEILKLVNAADIKYKAIILLLASSGMRVGAIPDLLYGNITKIKNTFKIIVYQKSKEEYYTFCTPEAHDAINEYLDYRSRCGEKIKPEFPLFREDFDPDQPDKVRRPKKLALPTVIGKIRSLLIRTGISEHHRLTEINRRGKRRNEVQTCHGFRKYAVSAMGKARLNLEIRKMLTGHSIGVEGAYLRYDIEEMFEEYTKAIDLLTIDEANRLKKKVADLEKETSEIQRLSKQVKSLQQYQKKAEEIMSGAKELLEVFKIFPH
ncbi:MAG: hypothetical protein DLM72_21505 [Candidatus Nitrosopolaris wilkensis]|nr:MAG: hypothetical protein DLM72_21505 [Candidatus Nitrosopolaris wilkensis]